MPRPEWGDCRGCREDWKDGGYRAAEGLTAGQKMDAEHCAERLLWLHH